MKRAILLIGHGSRDSVAAGEFLDFARRFQAHNGFKNSVEIDCAFLELSGPLIPEALNRIAEKGVKKIAVIPYLLFSAGHVKTEIPEILLEFSHSHPEIEIQYGNCLWPHENLIELAKERIGEALSSFPAEVRDQVDVLVVGRGATDPEAIGQFEEAMQKLRRKIACRELRHCFIALAEPKYAEALPELLQNGAGNLVIFPFYLFTGILVKRIESQVRELEMKHLGKVIKIAPYFGTHPLMFEMLRDKIMEKIGATI